MAGALARRDLAQMANERQRLLKRRVGLFGRRVHARILLIAGSRSSI
ncbi:MAG: hypothetical protein U0232_19800 [Thermomicrobiales bacterium]